MSSSVGMMAFPTEWKFIKFHGSSHHQPAVNPIIPYIPSGKRLHNYGKSPFIIHVIPLLFVKILDFSAEKSPFFASFRRRKYCGKRCLETSMDHDGGWGDGEFAIVIWATWYNPSDLHGISRVNPLITGVINPLTIRGMSQPVTDCGAGQGTQ